MGFEEDGNVQIDVKSRQNNGTASAIMESPLAGKFTSKITIQV